MKHYAHALHCANMASNSNYDYTSEIVSQSYNERLFGENESSDSNDEECPVTSETDSIRTSGPQPYRFEPTQRETPRLVQFPIQAAESNENEIPPDPPRPPRMGNRDWCQCGHCDTMNDEQSCICCCEVAKVNEEVDKWVSTSRQSCDCITEHPGFDAVCLNPWVLRTAYRQYRQHYGTLDGPTHERYRYTAYRQLVQWCWGWLGRYNRVILPSCAVLRIRENFPSDFGYYRNFQFPNM
ncbi:P2X purinoceptor 7-like [Ptychodera flava]|uniref:P2X purinoceptor 7-like n=1 Tax=Ptychodera flava TaxID=63121 RepID=UPI003969DAC5